MMLTEQQRDRMIDIAAMNPSYDATQDDALIATGLAYEEDGLMWPMLDERGRVRLYDERGRVRPEFYTAAGEQKPASDPAALELMEGS